MGKNQKDLLAIVVQDFDMTARKFSQYLLSLLLATV